MKEFIPTVTITLEEYQYLISFRELGIRYNHLKEELEPFITYPKMDEMTPMKYEREYSPYYRVTEDGFEKTLSKLLR